MHEQHGQRHLPEGAGEFIPGRRQHGGQGARARGAGERQRVIGQLVQVEGVARQVGRVQRQLRGIVVSERENPVQRRERRTRQDQPGVTAGLADRGHRGGHRAERVASQPDRPTRLDRLGERRQPTAILDEILDGGDDRPVTLGEPVADLVERPELDPRVVQGVAEPVVKP
jgi:hypothetical protein